MPGGSCGLLWLHRSLQPRLGRGRSLVVGRATHLRSCSWRVFSSPTSSGGMMVSNRIAGTHEPGLVGQDDRLHAVAELQLAEDARDVTLDGRFAQKQPVGKLGVRKPLREELQDFQLALGEGIESRRRSAVRVRQGVGEAVEESPGHAWCEQRLSRRYDADRVDELRWLSVLH